ncbi:MAG: hypothetical protein ACYS8I_11005 [Planctomycetota bacterium]
MTEPEIPVNDESTTHQPPHSPPQYHLVGHPCRNCNCPIEDCAFDGICEPCYDFGYR